jgi:hypothetical protein
MLGEDKLVCPNIYNVWVLMRDTPGCANVKTDVRVMARVYCGFAGTSMNQAGSEYETDFQMYKGSDAGVHSGEGRIFDTFINAGVELDLPHSR